ncbi:acidic mammalian chitinase-like [Octopus vulgaris]|uniref:Acidic mammalian chitinase-like n=2 Tax=Octopus TaxID=6643 RepID=A0AA36EXF6_OCTVU|nr:acidic mammalian chitinase [Octopus sinensis]CAI9715520.1 acidic mammalian chitinase-like [Octopus vulgaris]
MQPFCSHNALFRGISLVLILLQCSQVWSYYIVCYFTNWSQYRAPGGKFFPEDIDPTLCTHINYAFGKVVGNEIHKVEWNDDALISRVLDLKKRNPNLKVSIAVGGWNARSPAFSQLVSSQQNINAFLTNSIKFLRKYGFDGLDIDWEYPTKRGGKPTDREGFSQLIRTLRPAYQREGLLLTAALSANTHFSLQYYNIPVLAQYLDFINLMTYDYHGQWEQKAGLCSPNSEIHETVDFYIRNGVPANKLTLGLPAYGRSFTLVDSELYGVDAPVAGGGQAGKYTREKGFLAYYEICLNIRNNNWIREWLSKEGVPTARSGNQWVGYDDMQSFREKSRYIIEKGLLGAMFWALDEDDFSNKCGNGKYPLLTTINNVLKGGVPPITHPTYQPITTTSTSVTPVRNTCDYFTSVPLYCGHLRGMFLYLYDCRCFILCEELYAKILRCPSYLLFNHQTMKCDWPQNVHCFRFPGQLGK